MWVRHPDLIPRGRKQGPSAVPEWAWSRSPQPRPFCDFGHPLPRPDLSPPPTPPSLHQLSGLGQQGQRLMVVAAFIFQGQIRSPPGNRRPSWSPGRPAAEHQRGKHRVCCLPAFQKAPLCGSGRQIHCHASCGSQVWLADSPSSQLRPSLTRLLVRPSAQAHSRDLGLSAWGAGVQPSHLPVAPRQAEGPSFFTCSCG